MPDRRASTTSERTSQSAHEPVARLLAGSSVRFGAQDLAAHATAPTPARCPARSSSRWGAPTSRWATLSAAGWEEDRQPAGAAAETCVAFVESAVSSLADARADAGVAPAELVVAYEPRWAIGAEEPAPAEHTAVVCDRLGAHLRDRPGLTGVVVYGGSAGVGLLSRLHGRVDGLSLGRFAHDPQALQAILDEVRGTR